MNRLLPQTASAVPGRRVPLAVEAARQEIGSVRLGRQGMVEDLGRLGHQEFGVLGVDDEPAQLGGKAWIA